MPPQFQRQKYFLACDTHAQAQHAEAMLRLFLAQDGSTTRLCEALAGGRVSLQVLAQSVVPELPAHLAGALPGARFLRRLTSLGAQGQVMLDSISYIAIDAVDARIVSELEAGVTPIGHLLARLWTRRGFRAPDPLLFEELWPAVGEPDLSASRSYTVFTPEGPCMLIGETFRRGMLAV
jgi:chorismate-pyruvate lyase